MVSSRTNGGPGGAGVRSGRGIRCVVADYRTAGPINVCCNLNRVLVNAAVAQ